MIQAREGWAVLEYDRGESHVEHSSGILVPTARTQRMTIRGKTHTISSDPDANLPDAIRIGTVISSKTLNEGIQVLFNKHNGYGFDLDGKYLYLIEDKYIAAAVIPDEPVDNRNNA